MSSKSLHFPKWVVVLGILVIVGVGVVAGYNSLVNLEEESDKAFSNIETQYQRRMDLIPNLVSTIQGSADFESDTLQNVVEARSAWASAGTDNEKIDAANSFDSALSRLLVTVESYPQLQTTQAYQDLMTQLEGTENRVAYARTEYNTVATEYNKSARMFPRNLIAKLFGFDSEKELFNASEGADVVPVVDFGTNK